MSDDEYDTHCPLCCEEMDISDQNFLPCPCGYKVCMWCWHHIRENLNGLCPACRTPYNSDPHAFSAVDREDVVKLKKEKKQKEKQEKKVGERIGTGAPGASVKSGASAVVDRRHLHNYRVVQRNLVYVIGVPAQYAFEETLRKPEFFSQYGKIGKIVIHRNPTSAHTTVSVYVTFVHREDAKACIQSLDGHWLDQTHVLRASFGTTKYCNNFIRGVPCNNPECVYLHDLGDDDDRFTKEEIQAGHSKIAPVPGKDQTLVTGNGGPSGTGKRPAGEPVLPPPVFIQDNNNLTGPASSAAASASTAATAASASAAAAPAAIGSGIGVSIVVGRPAPVSRSGTATWGAPATLAAIVSGTADGASPFPGPPLPSPSTASMPAPGLTPTPTGASQREVHSFTEDSAAATATTSGVTTPASAVPPPPGGLKRGASNISLSATSTGSAATAPTPAATIAPAPVSAPSAPAAAAPTTTPAPAAPAAAPPVKAKPKTAKEIAAEKKAALAAAKAAQATEAAAAAAAAQVATAADAESKGTPPTTGIAVPAAAAAPALAPTPKLTARQQMLQNKAEKAAARAERAAERAAEKSAALAEKQAAAAAAAAATQASSQPAVAETTATGSGVLGGEVVPPTTGSTAKVSAIIKRPDSKVKQAAALAANATPATLAPASTATPIGGSAADSQESIGVPPPLVLPEATQPAPLLFWSDAPRAYNRFNGLSANAVFPVPSSSLHCSIWSNILKGTNDDLSVNPYGLLTTPISELLDLTLPPGDALLSAGPVWPRPMSYYANGMTADGICWTPAGRHIHQRSAADMAHLPSLPPLPPPSMQPKADAVFQPGTRPATTTAAAGGAALPTPSVVQPPKAAKAQREEGSVERATREYRERAAAAAAANGNATATPAASVPTAAPAANAPAQGASMSALRQLFPGVKMSTASAGKK